MRFDLRGISERKLKIKIKIEIIIHSSPSVTVLFMIQILYVTTLVMDWVLKSRVSEVALSNGLRNFEKSSKMAKI